jgi:hypothetical protein
MPRSVSAWQVGGADLRSGAGDISAPRPAACGWLSGVRTHSGRWLIADTRIPSSTAAPRRLRLPVPRRPSRAPHPTHRFTAFTVTWLDGPMHALKIFVTDLAHLIESAESFQKHEGGCGGMRRNGDVPELPGAARRHERSFDHSTRDELDPERAAEPSLPVVPAPPNLLSLTARMARGYDAPPCPYRSMW